MLYRITLNKRPRFELHHNTKKNNHHVISWLVLRPINPNPNPNPCLLGHLQSVLCCRVVRPLPSRELMTSIQRRHPKPTCEFLPQLTSAELTNLLISGADYNPNPNLWIPGAPNRKFQLLHSNNTKTRFKLHDNTKKKNNHFSLFQPNRKVKHLAVRSTFFSNKQKKSKALLFYSNSKVGYLMQPRSCFFEREDPITNHNTVAACTNIWYRKRTV